MRHNVLFFMGASFGHKTLVLPMQPKKHGKNFHKMMILKNVRFQHIHTIYHSVLKRYDYLLLLLRSKSLLE